MSWRMLRPSSTLHRSRQSIFHNFILHCIIPSLPLHPRRIHRQRVIIQLAVHQPPPSPLREQLHDCPLERDRPQAFPPPADPEADIHQERDAEDSIPRQIPKEPEQSDPDRSVDPGDQLDTFQRLGPVGDLFRDGV